MSPTNREVQLRKTCQLYAYVLTSQGKEVAEHILECAMSYDYPVDCVKELYESLKALDEASFKAIVYENDSQEARDLAAWWEMYETYIPLNFDD